MLISTFIFCSPVDPLVLGLFSASCTGKISAEVAYPCCEHVTALRYCWTCFAVGCPWSNRSKTFLWTCKCWRKLNTAEPKAMIRKLSNCNKYTWNWSDFIPCRAEVLRRVCRKGSHTKPVAFWRPGLQGMQNEWKKAGQALMQAFQTQLGRLP